MYIATALPMVVKQLAVVHDIRHLSVLGVRWLFVIAHMVEATHQQ